MEEKEIDLIDIREFLYTLWQKKAVIIFMMMVGIIIGLVFTIFLLKPMYKSVTTLVLTGTNEKTNTITSSDVTLNSKLVSTYSEIIKSRAVAIQVINELGLDISEDTFTDNISVTSKTGTELLVIQVANESGKTAADIANKIAEVFSAKIKEIYNIENVSVIDVAIEEKTPYNVSLIKNIVIFAFGGIVIAIGIIFCIMLFDNTVKNQEEVERILGIPVIAVIPKIEQ